MTEKMRSFDSGATRSSEEGKYDYEGFLSPRVLERYAEYMNENRVQADGVIRDSDNWQKGMGLNVFMKSLWRHFMSLWKLHRGIKDPDTIETALCALMFNVMGYMHEVLVAKELNMRTILTAREEKVDAELRFKKYDSIPEGNCTGPIIENETPRPHHWGQPCGCDEGDCPMDRPDPVNGMDSSVPLGEYIGEFPVAGGTAHLYSGKPPESTYTQELRGEDFPRAPKECACKCEEIAVMEESLDGT